MGSQSYSRYLSSVVLLSAVISLNMISCNNSDNKSSITKPDIAKVDITKQDALSLPYQSEYFKIDSSILSIKVFSMPELFNLDSLMSQAQMQSATGRFLDYGIDTIYNVVNDQIDLKFCEANEVGFRKRYEYFITARVNRGYTLDGGLRIGEPAEVLLQTSDKHKRIRVDKLHKVEFYDHWSIYTHTYYITDGMIESLVIDF